MFHPCDKRLCLNKYLSNQNYLFCAGAWRIISASSQHVERCSQVEQQGILLHHRPDEQQGEQVVSGITMMSPFVLIITDSVFTASEK